MYCVTRERYHLEAKEKVNRSFTTIQGRAFARKILTQRPWGTPGPCPVSLQGFFFLHVPRHLDPVNIKNSRETQSSGTLP